MKETWLRTLATNTPFRARLSSEARTRLDHSIQMLVADKNWEGCGGLELNDSHRVTIAAHIARLTLGFVDDYFDEVQSILVYPSAYEARHQNAVGAGIVIDERSPRIGEAWYRGPVILAWSDVRLAGRDPGNPSNVVLHEFAHQLDMRNGRAADGIPVIESREEAEEWLRVTSLAYDRLCAKCQCGVGDILSCYGTTHPAEFFAVATEAFFETPRQLAASWPDLFHVLSRFYRQQPE